MFNKELERFDLSQIKITENLISNYFTTYTDAYIFHNKIRYENIYNENNFIGVLFKDKKLNIIEMFLKKEDFCNVNIDFFNEISKLGNVNIIALKINTLTNTYDTIILNSNTTFIEKVNYLLYTASYVENYMVFNIFLTIS